MKAKLLTAWLAIGAHFLAPGSGPIAKTFLRGEWDGVFVAGNVLVRAVCKAPETSGNVDLKTVGLNVYC